MHPASYRLRKLFFSPPPRRRVVGFVLPHINSILSLLHIYDIIYLSHIDSNYKLSYIDSAIELLKSTIMGTDMFRKISSAQVLGTVIKDERKKRHLTQGKLGKLVGVDKATVSYIENGKPGVRLSTILQIVSALNIELVTQTRNGDNQPEIKESVKDTW